MHISIGHVPDHGPGRRDQWTFEWRYLSLSRWPFPGPCDRRPAPQDGAQYIMLDYINNFKNETQKVLVAAVTAAAAVTPSLLAAGPGAWLCV